MPPPKPSGARLTRKSWATSSKRRKPPRNGAKILPPPNFMKIARRWRKKPAAAATHRGQRVRLDRGNPAALVHLDTARDQRHRQENMRREDWSKQKLLEVDRALIDSVKPDSLPVPNQYARTNLVHTGQGREAVF